ncbi:MAG TPA: hypothetical protein VER35_02255 [Candidatus Limnocylindrales bacterium]|nr:hypothetical protein [Candidatus Limnocylindrales bacterium]
MKTIHIFISSVQKEFAEERAALRDYLRGDTLFRWFFDFPKCDMIKRCHDVGLDEPEFALTDGFVVTIRRKPELAFEAVGGITGEVTGEVQRFLKVLVGDMKRTEIQEALACPTTSVECYIKDCGKTKYLKQLDRFVFDEKKALKIRPVVVWKNPEMKESISQQ